MTDYTTLSENILVDLLRDDKLGAFKELYKRHWKKLYNAAWKRLRNKELCEEIVQELFTNLWVKRHSLPLINGVSSYLYSSVIHLVIDHYRKELVREKYREAFIAVHGHETDNSTEETILLKDLTDTIEQEISQLPDKCRSVYELSRKQHKTNKEIALYLGISEKTVENHLTKALKRLQLGLSHYLGFLVFLLIK
ncbi:RNA polymerase sigma-70 factor (ECF subfamily) [Mucilaginibacter yixingensis]|uniref:RNA polymerase sigma-70 factor (ECF subfamily) n=1 Tax=Mucilaginibacter yixingensis TaxID=1295612 RepID=A0A2T5JE40_9SPHI|nr:RNA polymerase sigma-70 factor [Mucilaginibacter yixingensis]PTR00025.1 RNA polymerase sigma-70 factor (ECF subfamily) [Mucilaginibacter yixingensis]